MSSRKQYTFINGVMSNLCNIETGVPQGSTLGPMLFLIYINELLGVSSFETKLFADDTSLLVSANNLKDLQHIINIEF